MASDRHMCADYGYKDVPDTEVIDLAWTKTDLTSE